MLEYLNELIAALIASVVAGAYAFLRMAFTSKEQVHLLTDKLLMLEKKLDKQDEKMETIMQYLLHRTNN